MKYIEVTAKLEKVYCHKWKYIDVTQQGSLLEMNYIKITTQKTVLSQMKYIGVTELK